MVNRRQFLRGNFKSAKTPQRPPWALAEAQFIDACTRCAACVPVCPTRIIVIVRGFPEVDFSRGECTFCGACADACKDKALFNGDIQARPWAIKAQVADNCLPNQGVECRICGDRCAVAAIRFSPRLGGPPLAVIDAAACTGCGACVAPCPVAAISVA
jgi:ferredoxin-type protein NapF